MGEPEYAHTEAAELDVHVRASRQLTELPTPFGENLVTLAGIGAEADGAADIVEHDWRSGKGAGQIEKVSQLGMVHPGVEAEVEWRQPGEALAHLRVQQ
jgi:hypothetical protein